jgi:hypothetical protein
VFDVAHFGVTDNVPFVLNVVNLSDTAQGSVSPLPEPSSLLLLGSGALGLLGMIRRKLRA